MGERPTKLAVIGLGMASKPHLAALKQLAPEIEVAGVYARSSERREAVTQEWGWPGFTSLDEIAASDADGAIVITPPNARAEIVGTLAAAGKAVLMEKPVERDLSRATRLVELCESKGVPLGIVFQHRFRAEVKPGHPHSCVTASRRSEDRA
jgi:predicted dehydrogenase